MRFTSKNFWDAVFCKWVEMVSSVKVLVLLATYIFGGWIIKIGVVNSQWGLVGSAVTLITTITTAVVVMREGFKMSSLTTRSNGNGKSKLKDAVESITAPDEFV